VHRQRVIGGSTPVVGASTLIGDHQRRVSDSTWVSASSRIAMARSSSARLLGLDLPHADGRDLLAEPA
jgi:hypothetical protein